MNFRWLYRQRIRIRLEGDVGDIEPFYLHEEQLPFHNSEKQYDLSITNLVLFLLFFRRDFYLQSHTLQSQ